MKRIGTSSKIFKAFGVIILGPSSLSQYRQQIGQFENRDPSSRVKARASERSVARANRNDQGNYNGRSVTAAKAMLGVIIASSIAAGVAGAAAASSNYPSDVSSSGCLTVSSTSSNRFRFGSVNVNNTCKWDEQVIFKRECIKQRGGMRRVFDVKAGETKVIDDVKGRCFRKNRWRSEMVDKEQSVLCQIARGPKNSNSVRLASEWASSNGVSCSPERLGPDALVKLKGDLKKCAGLNNKDRSMLSNTEKKQCYEALLKAGRFLNWEGFPQYAKLMEIAADEFEPGKCTGSINLIGIQASIGKVFDMLPVSEDPTEKNETSDMFLCRLSQGSDSKPEVLNAKKIIESSGIDCPEPEPLTKEEKISLQDGLVQCVGYQDRPVNSVTDSEKHDCFNTLKAASVFLEKQSAVVGGGGQSNGDSARASLLMHAAQYFTSNTDDRHINLNGYRGIMGTAYDMLCDSMDVDIKNEKESMAEFKSAREELCGISFGPSSDPQVKLAKEWINGSDMDCRSMIEVGGKAIMEQLRKDLVRCYGFNGKARKDISQKDKEMCQQALTDAALLMDMEGVVNSDIYAGYLRSAVNDFDPEQCGGHINLNYVQASFAKVNNMILAKLGSIDESV